jgi:hypothetical protein
MARNLDYIVLVCDKNPKLQSLLQSFEQFEQPYYYGYSNRYRLTMMLHIKPKRPPQRQDLIVNEVLNVNACDGLIGICVYGVPIAWRLE